MLTIVAGQRRGAHIETPPGLSTRPLRGRVRQALFDVLRPRMRGARVLDVFAGSGAVGLEAVSQGAAHCLFVEKDRECADLIRRNIAKLRFEKETRLEIGGALSVARKLRVADSRFDIVFLMPPYGSGLSNPVLEELASRGLVAPDALAVVEIEKGEAFEPPKGWVPADDRSYGVTRLVLLDAASP